MSSNLTPLGSDGGFNTTGNVVAGNVLVVGNIGPSGDASPAPTLSGFSSVSAITLSASGNITGGNITTAGSGGDIALTSGNITGANVVGANTISAAGNVSINANSNIWNFETTGDLTFPTGNFAIKPSDDTLGGSSVITSANNLVTLSTGVNGGTSSLWVEDYANVGSSNIAGVFANPTPGSGIVRIAVGQNGGNPGPNLWDFNANGNLTAPGNISATGNVTAANFFGNGSQLTGLPTSYTNLSVTNITVTGNVIGNTANIYANTLSVVGNTTSGNLLTTGIISATGNVTGNYFIGNGSRLTSITGANVSGNVSSATTAYNGNVTTVNNNQEYRPLLVTNTSGNLPFTASTGISWNPSTYALTAGKILLGSGIGAQGVTGKYAFGGNTAWAVQSQNGTGTDAQGQEIGRFGSEYTSGASTFWDSYVAYYQGSGANSGWMILNSAGNAVANITGLGVSVTGTVSVSGNVTGGNVLTGGIISSTGNITGGNISATAHTGTTVSVTGTVTSASVVGGVMTGTSTSVSGNVTGGNVLTGGLISATATVTGGNLATAGTASATGNITGGNILTGGAISAGGNLTVGNLIIGGSSGNIFGANNISANSFTATYTPGSTTGSGILSQGANTQGGAGYYDFLKATNQSGGATNPNKSFRLNSTGGLEIINSAYTSTIFSIADNGNAVVQGNLQVTGTLTYVSTTNLNVSNALITLANAATTPAQANGGGIQLNGANANIIYTNGNDAWNFNKPLVVTGGVSATGTVSATGNITGGNISATNHTGTTVSVTGTATAASVVGGVITGTSLSTTGTVTGGNVLTAGAVSAVGNITGSYIIGNGALLTGVTAYTNANVSSFLAAYGSNTISTTGTITSGNITGGNVLTGGVISSTGNITGGNISATNHTGTTVSVSGTVTAASTVGGVITGSSASVSGTVTAASVVGGVMTGTSTSVSGNVTGGNVLTGGIVSATGNITGGNISATTHTGTTVSVTGNITAGNIINTGISSVTSNITAGNVLTGGQVSATGNITTANSFVGNLVGTTASVTGNVTSAIVNANTIYLGGNLLTINNATTPVGFRATTPVTNMSVNNGSTVTMLFGTEEVDTNSAYNPATGRFTPNAAGYYSIDWFIVTSANGAGELIASLYKNGVLVAWGTNQTTATAHWNGMGGSAGMIYLNGTTDYISITLTNNSGSTATILAASGLSYFSAYLIR